MSRGVAPPLARRRRSGARRGSRYLGSSNPQAAHAGKPHRPGRSVGDGRTALVLHRGCRIALYRISSRAGAAALGSPRDPRPRAASAVSRDGPLVALAGDQRSVANGAHDVLSSSLQMK
jgi:hypothetical protein